MTIFNVFRKDLVVIRKNGSFVDGIFIEEVPTIFDIKASVQMTEAEVLQTLPEGYRTLESYTLYTDKELKTANEGVSNPDIVIIDGKYFNVVKVSPWKNGLLEHFEIVVVKENIDVNQFII